MRSIRPLHAPRARGHRALVAAASLVLAAAAATPARADRVELAADSVLAALVRDALAGRPELAGARANAEADAARVPQVRALPDPVVSFGVQNDGFGRLQVGRMETSYWSVSAAQTIPWAGKRGLRAKAQSLAAQQSEADVERVRLGVRADVERAYLDLLEVRDQLRILARLEALWAQADGLARSRYETGEGAQSDVLRAQLERSRLQQQRWALVAEERRRLAVLDRAAARPFDAPLATTLSLADIADPVLPDSATAAADAEQHTPELRKAALAVEQSGARVSLAHRDYFPDLTVVGGVMPRGGAFEPMWQAGVSLPLPLWARSKQSREVGESRLRAQSATHAAGATRRVVQQRLEERRAVLAALLESNRLYRSGVLIQSEATVTSALAQYQVGRVPFASVLEALRGFFSDELGYFASVAAAQRVDIAQRERSLDPVAGIAPGGLGGGAMTGSSGMGAASSSSGSTPSPAAAAGSSPSSAMPRMP